MSNIGVVFSSVGGVIVFIGAAFAVIRAVVRQSDSTDRNTAALGKLTKTVDELTMKVAILEDRINR